MVPRPGLLNITRSAVPRTTSRSLSTTPRAADSGKAINTPNTDPTSESRDIASEPESQSASDSPPPNPQHQTQTQTQAHAQTETQKQTQNQNQNQKRKSVAQTDTELRERLEQMSGEGGAAGIEYEDGQPNTMKRSVRNNMFRYI